MADIRLLLGLVLSTRLEGVFASQAARKDEAAPIDVLVAGGGPAGLAVAASLASSGLSVVVVERREGAGTFEEQKSYMYLVDSRGQKWTNEQNLTDELRAHGVLNADFKITRAYPDERGTVTTAPHFAMEKATGIWLARATLLKILAKFAGSAGVQVRYGTSLKALERDGAAESGVSAVLSDGTRFAPKLVLGCDGINSLVRASLKEWRASEGGDASIFEPVLLDSPSAGLKYKMLPMPPSFAIRNLSSVVTRGGPAESESPRHPVVHTTARSAYVVFSTQTSPKDKLFLGLLPSPDESIPRTANIIRSPNHAIWNVKTVDELYGMLEKAFPQVEDIRQLVPDIEAQKFVDGNPGAFPNPQYTRRVAAIVDGTGFALLGDAIHAFPPDLGQGVNSALEDVVVFIEALRAKGALPQKGKQDGGLQADALLDALETYQKERAPAAKALAQLSQFGFPYQYDQGTALQVKLFKFGFMTRGLLHKHLGKLPIIGTLFAKPAYLAVGEGQPYATVYKRVMRTTRLLQTIAMLVFLAISRQITFVLKALI